MLRITTNRESTFGPDQQVKDTTNYLDALPYVVRLSALNAEDLVTWGIIVSYAIGGVLTAPEEC